MPTQMDCRLIDLINRIKDFLSKGFGHDVKNSKELVQYYWKTSHLADELLRVTLGEKGIKFPVNIVEVAKKLDITIEEEDLNGFAFDKTMNKKIGQTVISKDDFLDVTRKTIYTDRAVALSAKRYAIAHEIAHCIMHYDKKDYYEDYCIMPLCPMDMEEIVADIFAIFLLIPVRLFFDEFKQYVIRQEENEKTPITTENWIKYLAERSLLPEYYVAYGYQQLRYVAYWIYQAWYCDEQNEEVRIDDIEKIKEETKEYFDEDTAGLVFQ